LETNLLEEIILSVKIMGREGEGTVQMKHLHRSYIKPFAINTPKKVKNKMEKETPLTISKPIKFLQ